MSFTFTVNTNRAFRSAGGAESTDMSERIARILEADSDASAGITTMMPELLQKWGFTGAQLKSFRFETTQSADSAFPIFHSGMALDLIKDFLSDPDVSVEITIGSGSSASTLKDQYKTLAGEGRPSVDVDAQSLGCSETTLTLLNRVLHCPQLIRNPSTMPTAVESSATDVNKVFRYPTIRQMDIFLPNSVTVSDALREYVMLPDDMHSENRERMLDAELGDSEAPQDDVDLSESRAYPLLSARQRNEFLYHVFWRLVSGGTSLCQYEEDAIFYKLGARELYKDIVCVGRRKAVEGSARPELVIQSHVYMVKAIKVGPTKKVLALFPVSDDITPSNSNFAYVIINPSRREVVWWYNSFSSSF